MPVSQEALEFFRIALGIPRYAQDIRERDLPQETEQQRALNFNKGCYVGQEIVERIRSRGNVHRKFTGFHITGSPPATGTKIQTEGKDVGEITSAALIPAFRASRPWRWATSGAKSQCPASKCRSRSDCDRERSPICRPVQK